MVTESGYKKEVTSGAIQFVDRFTDPLTALIPVRSPKKDEAVELMKELQAVMRKHYLNSDNFNPLDVARCADSLVNMWKANQTRITEEKYNGKAQIPRVGN